MRKINEEAIVVVLMRSKDDLVQFGIKGEKETWVDLGHIERTLFSFYDFTHFIPSSISGGKQDSPHQTDTIPLSRF